jgi:hypothetical protein
MEKPYLDKTGKIFLSFLIISLICILSISFIELISWVWSLPFIIYLFYIMGGFLFRVFENEESRIGLFFIFLFPVILLVVILLNGIELAIGLPLLGMMGSFVVLVLKNDYDFDSIFQFLMYSAVGWGIGAFFGIAI